MKAIVCHRVGTPDVLRLEDIDTPEVPDDGVLVRIHAASVNPLDLFPLTRMGYISRALAERSKPRAAVLGTDFAGTVESVGRDVTEFRPGDAVFGAAKGTFAEYICLPASGALVRKPANVLFDQAAAVPVAGLTALQAVRTHGHIRVGQKVLINGASGGVGTFSVQLAKALGGEVTAVCSSRNVDTVRSIGADRVIDYTREDFIQSGQRYDLMLDIAGSRSWSECTRVLRPRAALVVVGVAAVQRESSWRALGHFGSVRLRSLGNSRRVAMFIAKLDRADLGALGDLMSTGRLKSVIDRRYGLSEVPDALRYMQEGHARGKILIDVAA